MKRQNRHICVLLAIMLVACAVVIPVITAGALADFDHPLSDTATALDKSYVQELKNTDKSCIYTYATSDFSLPYYELFGDKVVDDQDAYRGTAAELRADNRKAIEPGSEKRFDIAKSGLPVFTISNTNSRRDIGVIPGSSLIADGNYHLYKLDDVVIVEDEPIKFLVFFNDWGFQLADLPTDIMHGRNSKVDLYFSMKITGDLSFSDENNLPSYYIDRVVVAGPERLNSEEITANTEVVHIPEETEETTVETTVEPTEITEATQETTEETTEATEPTETTEITEATENTTEPETPEKGRDKSNQRIVTVLGVISGVVLLGGVGTVYYLLRKNKKKVGIIVAVAAAVVLLALLIALIVCAAGSNAQPADPTTTTAAEETTAPTTAETTAEETTVEATEETTEPPTTESPTTEPLTAENALDLGKMQIVLPVDATDVEKTAANELATYVNKMTGQTLSVVTEGTTVEAGIYVGDTAFAKSNNVTHPTTEYGEGWAIKAVDGNLVLCGDATRGTLYAVYHLLEDALGVHWWTYTEEYVPTLDAALVWNQYDDSGAPAFKYRDMHPGMLHSTENLFQVRNRLNGWDSNPPAGYGGEENFGSPVYVHTFNHYVPDGLFSTHPEWFSLVGGQRVKNSQLCLTNQDLLSYMKEKLLRYIESDKQYAERSGTIAPRWYALVPNDWDLFCECEACQAVVAQSGRSGYLLKFVNEIAAAVEVEYPDVLVDTLAYWQYIEPPKDDTKPAKNVQIRFADNLMDVFHSYDHLNNEKALRYLRQWAEITEEGQLFVWDYVVIYGVNGMSPTMYKYPEHFRTLLEEGVTGYFGEQEDPINTDLWDLKMWLNAKLLEDPYQDFDALLDTFVNGYYGAAGPYVRRYLDLVGGLLENSYTYGAINQRTLSPGWLTYDAAIAADTYFDMAFEAADGDETILARLRIARNCLNRVLLEKFDSYQADAEEAGKTFDFDKKELCQSIIRCINEQVALRGDVDYKTWDTLLPYYQNILESLG